MSTSRVRYRVKQALEKKQDALDGAVAWLGNDAGAVDVPGAPGRVYARVGDATVEVTNQRVAPDWGLPVVIGYDPLQPRLLQVLSTRALARYGEQGVATAGAVGRHGKTHRWLAADGGDDVVFAELRQFLPLRLGPAGGLSVEVYRGLVWAAGGYVEVPTTTINMSAYVPQYMLSGAGKARLVLVTISTAGAVVVTPGAEVDANALALSDLPDAPANALYTVGAVRLYTDQTEITEARTSTDVIDLRFPGAARDNRSLTSIILYHGAGVSIYPATDAGLDAASDAAAPSSLILIPPMALVERHTLRAAVNYRGAGEGVTVFRDRLTLSGSSSLMQASVIRESDYWGMAEMFSAIVGPENGVAHLDNVTVMASLSGGSPDTMAYCVYSPGAVPADRIVARNCTFAAVSPGGVGTINANGDFPQTAGNLELHYCDLTGDVIGPNVRVYACRIAVADQSYMTYLAGDRAASNHTHTGYDTASLIDAKGDLLVGSAADTLTRLPVGTVGQVLTPNPAAAGGVAWSDPALTGAGVSNKLALWETGSKLKGSGITVDADGTITVNGSLQNMVGSPGGVKFGLFGFSYFDNPGADGVTWYRGVSGRAGDSAGVYFPSGVDSYSYYMAALHGEANSLIPSGKTNTGGVYGFTGTAYHRGDGTIRNMMGVFADAGFYSSPRVPFGTITNLYGGYFTTRSYSDTTVGTAHGVYISQTNITSPGTTLWDIYAATPAASSHIAGSLRIGRTTGLSNAGDLDVNGNFRVHGSAASGAQSTSVTAGSTYSQSVMAAVITCLKNHGLMA
jgi:hypothetical protein